MGYETIDFSGDIGIRASGKSCQEAWINAALGMYSLITDIKEVGEGKTLAIEAAADSEEGLLVRYLNELIFHFDTYGFVGSRLQFDSFSERAIKAVVYGETFDRTVHEPGLLLKAATYHNLRMEKSGDGCMVEVIFDI
jgi:SHS2 domain-containing protein